MTDELVKRYDVYPAYHGVDVEECHVGEFVYYADHADRIEKLTAERDQWAASFDEACAAWQQQCEHEMDKTKAAEAERDRLREALEQFLIEYDVVDLANAEPSSLTAAVLEARAALKGGTP